MGPGFLRMFEDVLGTSILVDHALVHEEYPAGHFPGKGHFMGHDQHRAPFPGQIEDDGQHLAHHGNSILSSI